MRSLLVLALLCTPAVAHDSWISEGLLHNPAGEWCCGKMDCGVMSKDAVIPVEGGYSVNGSMYIEAAHKTYPVHEFVPNAEAQPSPDGAYWRCATGLDAKSGDVTDPRVTYPGGQRRCFFFPPPNT